MEIAESSRGLVSSGSCSDFRAAAPRPITRGNRSSPDHPSVLCVRAKQVGTLVCRLEPADAVGRKRPQPLVRVDTVDPRGIQPEDLRLDLRRERSEAEALLKFLRHLQAAECFDL